MTATMAQATPAASKRIDEIRAVRRMNIVQKARRIMRNAAHSECQQQRDQENAKGVVPIKQLEAIVPYTLIRVCPGSPTDGAGDHHEKSKANTMRYEHKCAVPARAKRTRHVLPTGKRLKQCRLRLL